MKLLWDQCSVMALPILKITRFLSLLCSCLRWCSDLLNSGYNLNAVHVLIFWADFNFQRFDQNIASFGTFVYGGERGPSCIYWLKPFYVNGGMLPSLLRRTISTDFLLMLKHFVILQVLLLLEFAGLLVIVVIDMMVPRSRLPPTIHLLFEGDFFARCCYFFWCELSEYSKQIQFE